MIVDCAHYKGGVRQNTEPLSFEEAAACRRDRDPETGEFVWIGLHEPEPGPHRARVSELEEVAKLFDLHELAVEDAENAHQRPKIEDYDEDYFIVLRTAHYHEEAEEVHFGETHVFIGPGYVISVRHGVGSELASTRKRLESRPDLLKLGPASALWAILDKVVDDYQPVVEGIEDDIEEVENDVFDDDIPAPTHRIYNLKREVIEFHRAVSPLLAPLGALEQGAFARVPDELRRFFRDVADHARRVDEMVNSQRELLTSILEANLALVSVTQNEVVKKISAVAGIIAVPTLIASNYGMNFEHMPELDESWGYWAALAAMMACVIALTAFFKRINWL